jgi:hypothetical protein
MTVLIAVSNSIISAQRFGRWFIKGPAPMRRASAI